MDRDAPETPAVRPAGRSLHWLALAGIAALALAPRLLLARHSPLYADEIYVVMLARKTFAGLTAVVAEDVEQPLFYALAWVWRLAGGDGQLWMKLLPIAAGVATVVLVVPLGRRMFGPRAAWLAAGLLALQRTHVIQSQKVIPSTVLWLFLFIALGQGWAWLAERRRHQVVLFVLAGAAAIYTYYFALFPLAVLAVYGVVALWNRPQQRTRWLQAVLLMLLLFAPQMPTWWGQLLRDVRGDLFVKPMSPGDLVTLQHKLTDATGIGMLLLTALAAFALRPRATRSGAALLWAMTLVPALVPFVLSRAGIHLFFWGQMQFALPFVCLLVAAGCDALPGRFTKVLAGLAILGVALHSTEVAVRDNGREPLLQAVDFVRQHQRPGDIMVCCEPQGMLFFQYHFPTGPRYRLMQMPGAEVFHYSDGVLVIPDSCHWTPPDWAAERARGTRWWGLRVVHFPVYRTGAETAAQLAAHAAGPIWRRANVTLWAGSPLDATAGPGR